MTGKTESKYDRTPADLQGSLAHTDIKVETLSYHSCNELNRPCFSHWFWAEILLRESENLHHGDLEILS